MCKNKNIIFSFVNNITNDNYKTVFYKDIINKEINSFKDFEKNNPSADILDKNQISIQIQKKLIKDIASILNKKFKLSFKDVDYQIIIGHWVWRYCNIIITRLDNLNLLLKENPKGLLFSSNNSDYENITINTEDLILKSNNNFFNSSIYFKLLNNSLNEKSIFFSNANYLSEKKIQLNFKSFTKIVLFYAQYVFFPLIKRQNFFFYHSYIKKEWLSSIQKKLKIIPFKFFNKNLKNREVNVKLREELKISFKKITHTNVYSAKIYKHLLDYFPPIFLEEFKSNIYNTAYYPWPSKPKLIISSTSFDCDDYFKFYCLDKIKKFNTKILALQHGNNCGSFVLASHNPEQEFSNIFATWGWDTLDYKNHFPLFNIREPKNYKTKFNQRFKYPLLIQNGYPHDWNIYNETLLYEINHNQLLNSLSKFTINNKISIKRYHYQSDQQLRINSNFSDLSNINFVNSDNRLEKYLNDYDIIIFGYDSTGFFELINLNKPCLVFLDKQLELYNNKTQMIYREMINSKIFFTNYDLLFNHYIDIKDQIDNWWSSNEIQKQLSIFKSLYSQSSESPEKKFLDLINNV